MATREEQVQQDIKDLHGLGYAQELFRTMGGFSNFAISFSIISILTGAVILYDYGLAWAGTAAVMIGWPLITVFVLAIAASMAELASAYPTAGGLYYWASKMKNKNWGWWTAWLNLIGQFAIVAGIDYAAAGFINATIVDKAFGGTLQHRRVRPRGAQRPARDDGRDPHHPAGPQHRRHQPRGVAQPGQRVVAHRDRRGGGRVHLRHRQARSVGADARFHPAARPGRELEQQPRLHQPPIRPCHVLPLDHRVLLLAPPGELDVHGLRRLGPRGGGDSRRPHVERLGRLPVGRGQRGRRLHLPRRPDDPPAQPVHAVPEPPADRSVGRQPVLLRRRGRRHLDPRVQPRQSRRRPRRRDRDRHVVLRSGVAGRGRSDAVRLQPRRRDPGLRLAEASLGPLPDAGQRADRRRRRVLAVHRRRLHRRHRHGRSSSSPRSARSSSTRPTASSSSSGRPRKGGGSIESGASAAGRSRSPGWPCSGSSS